MSMILKGIRDKANKNVDPSKGEHFMTDDVAAVLVPYVKINGFSVDASILERWAEINKQAFNDISNPSSEFKKARLVLENLTRTNPQFAASSVALSTASGLGEASYKDTMLSFARNLAHDPLFSKKIIGDLEKNPSNLDRIMREYNDAREKDKVAEYIAGVKGVSVAAAPATPQPSTPAASVSPAPSSSVGANVSDLTDEQIEVLLKDPSRKDFAALLDQLNLRGKLKEVAKANPGILKTLKDPGALADYVSVLKTGDQEAFLKKLGGIQIQTGSGPVKMDDIFAQAKEGVLGMFGSFGGILETFGLGGASEQGQGLLGRLVEGFGSDPAKTAMKARTAMGNRIGDLLNSTDPEKRKYGEYVAKNMMAEHADGRDKNTQYLLVGTGFNLKQIEDVNKQGKAGLTVDITQLKVERDKDGNKFIQDPVVYKDAPVVQAAAPKPTNFHAERDARDQRLASGQELNIPGMSPATTTTV